MADSPGAPATVLIVDDDPDITDLYADWLDEDYVVRAAYGGDEALERFDDDVDVVLRDRRMPDSSGDDVLAALRERDGDIRVVMVTAVTPDYDILDLGFDAYVTKPADRDDLIDAVRRMLTRSAYNDRIVEYYRLVAKRAALEGEKPTSELQSSEDFADLVDRIETLEAEVDETLREFDHDDFEAALHDLDRG